MTDFLIVGLGNPGGEHAHDRHNAGAWVVNRLATRAGVNLRAGRNAATGKTQIAGADVVLARPRTWMNNSGDAVAPLVRREGVPIERLLVVYDELDLPEGRIRIRSSGGAGGHNGLKSIIAATGSSDFGRIRIGIGRPLHHGVPSWDPDVIMRHVLSSPPRASRELLDQAVERACDAIEAIIRDGWERAMDQYNRQQTESPSADPLLHPQKD